MYVYVLVFSFKIPNLMNHVLRTYVYHLYVSQDQFVKKNKGV